MTHAEATSIRWPEELSLYRWHLETNQPHTIHYKGKDYVFQFHGPTQGTIGNWLEVTREAGVAKKFGPGHTPEWVWRAFHHIDKGWGTPQVPAFREQPVLTNLEKRGLLLVFFALMNFKNCILFRYIK